jgi:hypothetical protein
LDECTGVEAPPDEVDGVGVAGASAVPCGVAVSSQVHDMLSWIAKGWGTSGPVFSAGPEYVRWPEPSGSTVTDHAASGLSAGAV